jgi:hypothetical protein
LFFEKNEVRKSFKFKSNSVPYRIYCSIKKRQGYGQTPAKHSSHIRISTLVLCLACIKSSYCIEGGKGIPMEEDPTEQDLMAHSPEALAEAEDEEPAAVPATEATGLPVADPAVDPIAELVAEPKTRSTRRCATCLRLAPNHKALCGLKKVGVFFYYGFAIPNHDG